MLDCLEFDDNLRYVDAIDDAAFLAMDLEFLGRKDLGHFFPRRVQSARRRPRTDDGERISTSPIAPWSVPRSTVCALPRGIRTPGRMRGAHRHRAQASAKGHRPAHRRRRRSRDRKDDTVAGAG